MKQLNLVKFFENYATSNGFNISLEHIDDDYVIGTKIYNPDVIEFFNWFLGQFSSFYKGVLVNKNTISTMAYSRNVSNNDIKYLHAVVLYVKSDNELCFTTTSNKAWKPSIVNQFDSSRKNNIKNKLAHVIQAIFGLKEVIDDNQTIKQFLDSGKYSNVSYSTLNNLLDNCLNRLTFKDLKILCNILSNKKVNEDAHYNKLVGCQADPIISEYLETIKQNAIDEYAKADKKLDKLDEKIKLEYIALQKEYADDLSYNMITNSYNHTRDNKNKQDEFRAKREELIERKAEKMQDIKNEFNAIIDKAKDEIKTTFPAHANMLTGGNGYFNFICI